MSVADTASDAASPEARQPAGGSPLYDPSTDMGQVGIAFKRAMVAVRRLRGRESQRLGQLSFAQLGLLHGLAGRPECSARQLAELSDLSPATVTQMLESLEAAGLVTRTRSAQDRRVVHTVLTEDGAALVAERQRAVEDSWKQALSDFSSDELATAARVLNRVADVVDSFSRETPAE